jgi:hypothetical protein
MVDRAPEITEAPKPKRDMDKVFEETLYDETRQFVSDTPPVTERTERDINKRNMEAVYQYFKSKKTGEKVVVNWPNHSLHAVVLLTRNDKEHNESAVRLKVSFLKPDKTEEYDLLVRKDNDPDEDWSASSLIQHVPGKSKEAELKEIHDVIADMAQHL